MDSNEGEPQEPPKQPAEPASHRKRGIISTSHPANVWYVIAMGFTSTFIALGAGWGYVNHIQHDAKVQAEIAKHASEQAQQEALRNTCKVLDTLRSRAEAANSPNAEVWTQLEVIIACPK